MPGGNGFGGGSGGNGFGGTGVGGVGFGGVGTRIGGVGVVGGVGVGGVGVGGTGVGGTTKSLRRNQSLGALASTLPRNSRYSNGPATTRLASWKAPATVEPPLIACTTGMPLATVSAPVPPALMTWIAEVPVALPPLMTSRSEGELSPARRVFRTILLPPAPT